MGNFRRIYPAAAPPVQAKYEWLLQGSARMFATSMKAKAHNTIGRIQVGLCVTSVLSLLSKNSRTDFNRSRLDKFPMLLWLPSNKFEKVG